MNLYFIALIPYHKLREQIMSLKEEMKERFNAKHALKSPAHITLQMPFKRSKEHELHLINTLQKFGSRQQAFTIELSGFDCFAPRVIFVKVTDHNPIVSLHAELKKPLIDNLVFDQKEITTKIHPHMTIATRDLIEGAFDRAWLEFEKRKFRATFLARSIFLLKHNGKYWDILMEFPFKA